MPEHIAEAKAEARATTLVTHSIAAMRFSFFFFFVCLRSVILIPRTRPVTATAIEHAGAGAAGRQHASRQGARGCWTGGDGVRRRRAVGLNGRRAACGGGGGARPTWSADGMQQRRRSGRDRGGSTVEVAGCCARGVALGVRRAGGGVAAGSATAAARSRMARPAAWSGWRRRGDRRRGSRPSEGPGARAPADRAGTIPRRSVARSRTSAGTGAGSPRGGARPGRLGLRRSGCSPRRAGAGHR